MLGFSRVVGGNAAALLGWAQLDPDAYGGDGTTDLVVPRANTAEGELIGRIEIFAGRNNGIVTLNRTSEDARPEACGSTGNTLCFMRPDREGTFRLQLYSAPQDPAILSEGLNFLVGPPRDVCGVCGGDNSSCKGCDGKPNSGKVLDECGVCGGDDSSCAGCDGRPNSGAELDACGVCGGDDSSCLGCDGVPLPKGGKQRDACGTCGGSDDSCGRPPRVALLPLPLAFACLGAPISFAWWAPTNRSAADYIALCPADTPRVYNPFRCQTVLPPHHPHTKWTRRVPHPVLGGHAASLTPY